VKGIILLKRKIWNVYCTSNYFAHGAIGRTNTKKLYTLTVRRCIRAIAAIPFAVTVCLQERVRYVTCLVGQISMHGLLQEPAEEHLSLSILSFQNFYGGICLYLAQLSVKLVVCRLSFVCYHCLEYVGWYTSNSQTLVLPFTSVCRNCCFNTVLVI